MFLSLLLVIQQEGLDARVRKKEEAKLQELKLAIDDHKRAEKERIYAVRYHKVWNEPIKGALLDIVPTTSLESVRC